MIKRKGATTFSGVGFAARDTSTGTSTAARAKFSAASHATLNAGDTMALLLINGAAAATIAHNSYCGTHLDVEYWGE
jgi:hypothetical protein